MNIEGMITSESKLDRMDREGLISAMANIDTCIVGTWSDISDLEAIMIDSDNEIERKGLSLRVGELKDISQYYIELWLHASKRLRGMEKEV